VAWGEGGGEALYKNTILKPVLPQSLFFFQGEDYQLFWPERSEFVRMAARFGAKIVPFGAVGEDDLGQVGLMSNFSFLVSSYMKKSGYKL